MARSWHRFVVNIAALGVLAWTGRASYGDALVSLPAPANVAEAFVGQGKTGPYLLSWSKLVAGSETVWLNSVILIRGIDYSLDYEAGQINFVRPLNAAEMARVTYARRGDAARQSGATYLAGQALVLPMGEFMGAELRLRALSLNSGQSPGAQVADAPKPLWRRRAVYGVQATREAAGTKLTGEVFLRPPAARRNQAGLAPLGWSFSAERKTSSLRVAARAAGAQEGFGPDAAAAGVQAGASSLSLEAQYDASPHLAVGSSYARILSGGTGSEGGQARQTTGGQVGETFTYTASVRVPGPTAARGAAATAEQRVEKSGQATSTTTQFDLRSALTSSIELQAGLRRSLVETTAGQSAGWRTPAETSERSGRLNISAGNLLRLGATMAEREQAGERTSLLGFEGGLEPSSQLALTARYARHRMAGGGLAEGAEDDERETKAASLKFSPDDRIRVEAEYAENPEDQAGHPQQATTSKIALITDLGRLALSGSLGQREDISGAHDEKKLGLSLALSRTQKLYGGYRLTADTSSTDLGTTYRLGYNLNRGSALQFSLEGQLLLFGAPGLATERAEKRAEARLSARF
jgi:hypothetical protein